MPNKNKTKGTYHEKWIVDWLIGLGLEAKRQPLSGSLGGEYSGDIITRIMGHRLVGEVKYRDLSGFPSPFTVMEGRDIAFYKRRRGTPQVVVIMTADTFQKLMENRNDRKPEPDDP
jgi:Holliday junction resolvase